MLRFASFYPFSDTTRLPPLSLPNFSRQRLRKMAPYEETKGVPKLTANNYSEWARRMSAVFRAKKLWQFLYLHDPASTMSTTRRTTRITENQGPEELPGPATTAVPPTPTLPTPSY